MPQVSWFAADIPGSAPCVAVDGDLVTLHYDCKDGDGQVCSAVYVEQYCIYMYDLQQAFALAAVVNAILLKFA
jgi:hypothetical protein